MYIVCSWGQNIWIKIYFWLNGYTEMKWTRKKELLSLYIMYAMISGFCGVNKVFVAMMLHVCWLLIWFDSKTLTDLDGHLSTKATRKRDMFTISDSFWNLNLNQKLLIVITVFIIQCFKHQYIKKQRRQDLGWKSSGLEYTCSLYTNICHHQIQNSEHPCPMGII